MANEKRLIDANALKHYVCELCNAVNSDEPCEPSDCRCMEVINGMPTVDAVEVVYGRWIEKIDMVASYLAECEELFYECSVCNSPNFGESPYCPNCGAKMDGDGNA